MRVDAQKNQKLLDQFKFLRRILVLPLEPYAGEFADQKGLIIDDLTITVEKADGDLMFRQGGNIGLGEISYFFGTKGDRKDQIGKQGEYLFAVDAADRIIRRVDWPRNREEARGKHPIYGYHALWGKDLGNRHLTDCLYDKVKFLVWVTVSTWHESTKNADQPFGKVCTRLMQITVYGQPEEGFAILKENSSVYGNLYLSNDVLIGGSLNKDRDIITINGHLGELCHSFQEDVYFNGMKKILDKGKYRGASGQFGPASVLAAEMCGYDRVMLQDNTCWVTYQLRPGGRNMYVLGCGGTLPQLRRLTRSVIEAWRNPENHKKFQPDKEVSVI